jgi:diguanylate cyclase (GGDEF)-like protein
MAKILVVDDNQEMVETLERLFSFYQFEVISAHNGIVAIERAEAEHPDLILLDAMMPGMDGFEACKILKSKNKTRDIPIIFLTAKYLEVENKITGLQLGADDYLIKPFNSKELITRIKTILKKNQMMKLLRENNESLRDTHEEMSREMKKLMQANQNLSENTVIDNLTGLYNKNFFMNRLKEEFHRALRYESPVSVIVLDVDSFSRINESLGYQVGDFILMKISNVILTNTRISDVVARIDGENFAVILPQTDEQGGYFEAERIRVSLNRTSHIDDSLINLQNLKRRRKNEHKNLTVSVGVATYRGQTEIKTEKDLMNMATQALDAAKRSGKNKTIAFNKMNQE